MGEIADATNTDFADKRSLALRQLVCRTQFGVPWTGALGYGFESHAIFNFGKNIWADMIKGVVAKFLAAVQTGDASAIEWGVAGASRRGGNREP